MRTLLILLMMIFIVACGAEPAAPSPAPVEQPTDPAPTAVPTEAPAEPQVEVVEDGECALRYAAETAEQYGGDPERVIWAGFRNGAGLGALLALGEGDIQASLEEYAEANNGPLARVTCAAAAKPAPIVGLVASAGIFPGNYWLQNDCLSWWTDVYSPMASYAALGNNPALNLKIIHASTDTDLMYAFEDAEAFAAALQEAGYDAEFVLGPKMGASPELMVEQIMVVADQ